MKRQCCDLPCHRGGPERGEERRGREGKRALGLSLSPRPCGAVDCEKPGKVELRFEGTVTLKGW